jgi:predicted O-methyltransferase YrrM
MTPADLETFLATYRGGVSVEEGQALSRYAEHCCNGVIVEIGTFRGKSAVALAFGQAQGRYATDGLIYCVDPHAPFVGIYGGVFGPQDRRDFYAIMLLTGFYDRVCPVNLKSEVASRGWEEPIGLLFIDGDHSAEGVAADVAAWVGRLAPSGVVIFDDAVDPAAGALGAIARLVDGGGFEQLETIGKMTALRRIRRESD